MRVSGLVSLVLAATPALVSAKGTLGFSLGNKNPDGTCKSTSDYEADFDALKDMSTIVRTYSGTECKTPENILPAAKNKGFKVVLGMWVGKPTDTKNLLEEPSFKKDWAAIQKAIPGYGDVIHAITVGSETLYRGDLTGPQLHTYISHVMDNVPKGVLVGTAESWNKLADGTGDALFTQEPVVKYVFANAFAYWQGTAADKAYQTYFDDMVGAMEHIQKIAGDNADKINIVTGETGWPTDGGSDYEDAKAGTKNAEKFWKTGICGMLDWGVDLFYFEAFDESWKPDTKGDNGEMKDEQHWGLFTAERKIKFDATCPK